MRWSADGRYLFLRQDEGLTAVRISRLDLASGREEPWKELKPADPVGVQIGEVVMTPDGNAYAYSFQRDISHVVSGRRAEVARLRSAVRDHQQRSRAFDDALHGAL